MLIETPPSKVSEQLRTDEKLLWFGKPNPLSLARKQLTPVLYGAVWIVFVIYGFKTAQTSFARQQQAQSFFGESNNLPAFQTIFLLVAVVFVGIGLWMISTPIRSYIKALRTFYAVTDQRALIISGVFSQTIIAYTRHDIRWIKTVDYSDGLGDVLFGYDERTYTEHINQPGFPNTNRTIQRSVTFSIGFRSIPDHQQVEALMRKTLLEPQPEADSDAMKPL